MSTTRVRQTHSRRSCRTHTDQRRHPHPPSGFLFHDIPVPLLGVQDGRWIVEARWKGTEGYLIFEENKVICFCSQEEMRAILTFLGDRFAIALMQAAPTKPVERTLVP